MVTHQLIRLTPKSRGFHLITQEVNHAVENWPIDGVMHLFIRHTSAGLCLNENADPTVRVDFESIFNMLVPENLPFIQHDYEGPDDMPAHIKAALVGSSISMPIRNGRLDLGTWQGIYLCEFRNHAGSRSLTATIIS
ncbi:MAG: YjbQ family protein [Saprospiraceae bacterium]|nr:YjbQ family protein [Saprospiraceae bacterium]